MKNRKIKNKTIPKDKLKTYRIHLDKLKKRKKRLQNELNNYLSLDVEGFVQTGYYSEEKLNEF
jgi:uncharacterized protein YdaU (DUF1376 family)